MKRTKSQLNAIYCSYRDRAERRRTRTKSRYYRRRLSKLGIDWKTVKRPYGTECIELD